MRTYVITLKPGEHWRDPQGKEAIRKALQAQGHELEIKFDGTIDVYATVPLKSLLNRGRISLVDILFGVLLFTFIYTMLLLFQRAGGL